MPRSTPTSESTAIGIRVQQERTRMGLTREQLAEMMDMSVWYITDIERGRSGLSIPGLIQLCEIFGCSADYLLFGRLDSLSLSARVNQLPPELRKLVDDILAKQMEIIEASQGLGQEEAANTKV